MQKDHVFGMEGREDYASDVINIATGISLIAKNTWYGWHGRHIKSYFNRNNTPYWALIEKYILIIIHKKT